MASKKHILDKIYRNCQAYGLTVSRSGDNVVVDNASNDFTISLVDADIQSPMGGISDAAAPFLGIGVANPSRIKMKSSSTANDDISDVIDGSVALLVFHLLSGFANNIILENSDATYSYEIRGHEDLIGMGM